ncbi:hypothetical protein [Thermococcus sp.]|uniref:hypothetical protein n=1 Tax=Thermococcus sp. TaxID=35749 RepID=UPI00263053D8|nr:hypothetical protein [Thermococcus sp.]
MTHDRSRATTLKYVGTPYTVWVFDEAQYLRYSNYDYTALLASLNDGYENITVILTGSEVQILEEFLEFNDRHSPLQKGARDNAPRALQQGRKPPLPEEGF